MHRERHARRARMRTTSFRWHGGRRGARCLWLVSLEQLINGNHFNAALLRFQHASQQRRNFNRRRARSIERHRTELSIARNRCAVELRNDLFNRGVLLFRCANKQRVTRHIHSDDRRLLNAVIHFKHVLQCGSNLRCVCVAHLEDLHKARRAAGWPRVELPKHFFSRIKLRRRRTNDDCIQTRVRSNFEDRLLRRLHAAARECATLTRRVVNEQSLDEWREYLRTSDLEKHGANTRCVARALYVNRCDDLVRLSKQFRRACHDECVARWFRSNHWLSKLWVGTTPCVECLLHTQRDISSRRLYE